MTSERRVSEYSKRMATQEGRLSLAAARLALRVSETLLSVKRKSGRSNKELATLLNVTEGRVSQIVNGNGNLHVATIARFLAACGYELSIRAVPVGSEQPIRKRERKGVHGVGGRSGGSWHVFTQKYLSSAGVTEKVTLLNGNDERPIPFGEPIHMGSLVRHSDGVLQVDLANAASAWQQRTQNAVDYEGRPAGRVAVS